MLLQIQYYKRIKAKSVYHSTTLYCTIVLYCTALNTTVLLYCTVLFQGPKFVTDDEIELIKAKIVYHVLYYTVLLYCNVIH